MTLTKEKILSELSKLKPVLSEKFSVKEIGLFGSYSKNNSTEDSDIDLLVELNKPIGWRIFTLEMYLESIFRRKVDLVTKNALKAQIKDQILQEVDFV